MPHVEKGKEKRVDGLRLLESILSSLKNSTINGVSSKFKDHSDIDLTLSSKRIPLRAQQWPITNMPDSMRRAKFKHLAICNCFLNFFRLFF